jgi:hypothetical protein
MEFTRLIPQIPFIGGRRNSFTQNLIQATWSLAFYRAMIANGVAASEVGRLLADIYLFWLDERPAWQLNLRGWFSFTPPARWRLNRRAQRSQEGKYPGDWVFRTSYQNGKEIGVDYTECGLLKYYQAQDALELLPYLCSLDFIVSERLNAGLIRPSTLAGGCSVCDFRFKRGRETVWSEEALELLG